MPRTLKNNTSMLNESWRDMVQRTTGVKDPAKLSLLTEIAQNEVIQLSQNARTRARWNNQLGGAFGSSMNESYAPGGAYYSANTGTVGNVVAPYQTVYNTVGIGNPVTAGKPALTGSDYTDNTQLGSGDKWPALLPIALKVAAKTIGFDIVNTHPLQGPTGVIPYMDYVYSGTKQPYGATPGYSNETQNPGQFHDNTTPNNLYGLPASFKGSFKALDPTVKSISEFKATALKNGLRAGDHVINNGSLDAEFIGWSRIDGDPMFKIDHGTASLGEIFANGAVDASFGGLDVSISSPRLISLLEDQIQGYTGSGPNDMDPWYGTYQDGTRLFEPMSRATGELSYARQISLQLFTRTVQPGTIMVSVAVTQEQVTDIQKQWNIDVLKLIQQAAVQELSSTINRHILSRVFALGWKNHCKLAEVEGSFGNLNISYASDPATAGPLKKGMTLAYAIPEADATQTGDDGTYHKWTNVAMPFKPLYMNKNAVFENQATLLQRLQMNILQASNWITQRGRYGGANFVITNITVAQALQSNAQNSWAPIANNIPQTGDSLYPLGKLAGITVYVDPLMAGRDCRVCVGRKGGPQEPGVIFAPYLLAESVQMIAEGTGAPKVMIKSRYALIDAGFYPETQYLTFVVDFAGMF